MANSFYQTMPNLQCKPLIMLEGCDGSGKSTLAAELCERLDAHYVHLGAMGSVGEIARLFVEAALPALLGDRPVVMDRCWLSDEPYATHYRREPSRILPSQAAQLDRLMFKCGALVVFCNPPWEACKRSFDERSADEYVNNTETLEKIHAWYAANLRKRTSLPVFEYDYTIHNASAIEAVATTVKAHRRHLSSDRTAGNLNAKILLVGENYMDHLPNEPLYQWPFGGLSGQGCSRWLSVQLESHGIDESKLLWTNADSGHALLSELALRRKVVALGSVASEALREAGVKVAAHFEHPQHHRRVKSKDAYPLIKYLEDELCN